MFQESQSLPLHTPNHFEQHDPERDVSAPEHEARLEAAGMRIRTTQYHEPKPHTGNHESEPASRVSADERTDQNGKDANQSYWF